MATNWYTWTSRDAFDEWHNNVIAQLDLPRPSVNAKTGQLDPTAQPTIAYTAVTEIAGDDWRAPVEPNIAGTFAAGLGSPSQPPPPEDT